MQFRSTQAQEPLVSFKDVVLRCLPPDEGLYVPAQVADMRQYFMHMDAKTTYPEVVATMAPALLQEELNPFSAKRAVESAFSFEPELTRLDDNISLLSLYNGPTGVFKDFGIAFLAAVMEELVKNSGPAMVLSASRGNVGVSLAQAFRGRKGIISVILYPAGPIRGLDPASFVTNGGNIIPIQITGTLDDCQRLIVEAIEDRPFAERYGVTSANAINLGRLLPQCFYYIYAFVKIKNSLRGDLVFSVPCGNFGNLIAGLYAWKFGMPVKGYIAAMNVNDAFGDYIRGRRFVPRPVVATNSPSLDVGLPSNYKRLAAFYEESPAVMRNMVYPASIGDDRTMAAIRKAWEKYGVLLDPHSAVAFAAAEDLSSSQEFAGHVHTVVIATGHPAKRAVLVSQAIGRDIDIPPRLAQLQRQVDPIAIIKPDLEALEGAIASCF
ncbi:MAG: threonine synthase [Treponema sp.]|jgi:threonine synthase|nr:threonine synthase [Treponema sp.]